MASRNYRAIGNAVKKVARPPAKTVVFSLIAFLIVAAAPYCIMQTDAVVEDGAEYLLDNDIYTLQSNVKGKNLNSGWMSPLEEAIFFSPVESGEEYFSVMDTIEFEFPVNKIYFALKVDKEKLNDEIIREVHFKIDPSFELIDFVLHLDGGEQISPSIESVDDGSYVVEFTKLESYKFNSSDVHYYNVVIGVDESTVVEPFDFYLESYYYDDDYTGSIIAFIGGVGLVILAVLSTSLVNPTRWGKRRR